MQPSRAAWAAVALLWVVAALNYLDRQVIYSLLPPLKTEFHATDFELGLLGTAFLWVYAALSPLGGYLADRYDRKKIVLASLGIWSAVTWLTGLSRNFPQLLAARGLMGISEAAYLPAGLALVADHHGPATRSRAVGLHQSGLYAGIALGGVVGGWIGEHFGWRTAFLALGVAGLVFCIPLAAWLRPAPRREGEEHLRVSFPSAVRQLFAARGFTALFAANIVASMATFTIYSWLPLHLFEKFRLGLTGAGFTATFYIQLASFAGILSGGWLADRWAHRTHRARALTQAIGFGAAGPALFLMTYAAGMPALVAAMLVFGLGRGFYDCNLMPVVCQMARPNLRATAYGVLNLGSTMVGGALTAVTGALKSAIGLDACLRIAAALVFVSALILVLVAALLRRDSDAAL